MSFYFARRKVMATQLFCVNIALAKGVVIKDEWFYQGKP
jgi:hypothetical protein